MVGIVDNYPIFKNLTPQNMSKEVLLEERKRGNIKIFNGKLYSFRIVGRLAGWHPVRMINARQRA